MRVRDRIEVALMTALRPQHLEIVDESAGHAGHAGARPEGETHFRVTVVAEAFRGVGRVGRHRLVTEALVELLAGPVHALSITARAPGEPPGGKGAV